MSSTVPTFLGTTAAILTTLANSITALQAIAILWMKVRFSRSDGARVAAH